MAHELSIPEELLLLALKDGEGTIHEQAGLFQYAIAGGVLAELSLTGRIALHDGADGKHVRVVDARPPGPSLVDECLRQVRDAQRPRDLAGWVAHLAQRCDLHHRAAADLCRRGVLRARETTVLLIFTRRRYPELDPRFEQRILARLRSAVLHPAVPADDRTLALLALADATRLLPIIFTKGELNEHRARIAALTRGDRISRHALAAAHAASEAALIACTASMAVITATAG